MNPLLGKRPQQLDLWRCFYPSLVLCEPRGVRPPEVRGDLARRWEWSAEGRTLSLVLREDRYWQDTTRVGVADVVRSYEAYRILGRIPPPAVRDSLPDLGLVAVEAVDDSTVRFRFRADMTFWRAVSAATWPILPAHKLGEMKPPLLQVSPLGREPFSAGPFRLLDWRPGLNLWMGANALAPLRRTPWLRRVALESCPGVDSRILRVGMGRADVAVDVPVYRLASLLQAASAVRVHREGVASVEMIFWNLARPGLGSTLREAVSFAVDRNRLVDALLTWRGERYGGPAGGLLEPAGPPEGDSLLAEAPMPRHDRVEAARLLDAAGWTETNTDGIRTRGGLPLRIELLYDRGNEMRERTVTSLEADLAAVGVQLDPVPLEGTAVWQRFRAGFFDTALLGFRPPSNPDLSPLWASWGLYNGGGYADFVCDSLISRQQASDSPEEIESLSRAIEARVRRDHPVTFLYYREGVDLLSPRVRDYTGTSIRPLGELETTWLADTTEAVEDSSVAEATR